jgi:hypothetical protein
LRYKLDIFRTLPDGQPLWLKTVEGLEEAKSQLCKLAELEPGDYFIYDTRLGRRVDNFNTTTATSRETHEARFLRPNKSAAPNQIPAESSERLREESS